MGEPCIACGDIGRSDLIVTCSGCRVTRQHVYCLPSYKGEFPDIWLCEECCEHWTLIVTSEPKPVLPHSGNMDGLSGEDKPIDVCPDAELESGNTRVSRRTRSFPPRDKQAAALPSVMPDNSICHAAPFYISNIQDWSPSYNLLDFAKYPTNRPDCKVIWSGNFEILGMVPSDEFFDFRAHPARLFVYKLYEYTPNFPKTLQLQLVPRSELADIPDDYSAPGKDISLYFFPSNSDRSLYQYGFLLGYMERRDLALRSCNNDMELLIFPSNQLKLAKGLNWASFLWAILRIKENKNVVADPSSIRASNDADSSAKTRAEQQHTRGKETSQV